MAGDDRSAAIHCPHCEKAVIAKIVGEETLDSELPLLVRFRLVKCSQCSGITLLREAGELFPEVDYDGNEKWIEDYNDPVPVYPPQEKVFDGSVPAEVVRAYSESIKCLKAGAYTAATIMGRRTLEIVCSELGAKGSGGLFKKIESLSNQGKFSGRVAEWATRLREIGNIAAHGANTTFNKNQARLVLDFTEALIENSFVMERKLLEFEKYTDSLKKTDP